MLRIPKDEIKSFFGHHTSDQAEIRRRQESESLSGLMDVWALDDSQMAFCHASPGNIRLLAPAGCGKTLSILFRCAHLAEQALPLRPRFLVVTFTVAARQELASRLHMDARFGTIRDQVEVITLNSWGFRRIKSASFSPKLITSKDEFFFMMKNQLQPVWQRHDSVKRAIEAKPNQTPRKIMNLIDAFKALGFDHVRHSTQEAFIKRVGELRDHGLGPKMDELVAEMVKLEILDAVTNRRGEDQAKGGDREIYTAFFRFWRDACEQLIGMSTFTLEDQKYFAYLDERQKVEEGKFLSGAAKYDHVMVDEFQDINPLDLNLLKAIAARNKATITIVGDDDQAIFEWRSATPQYILEPDRHFGVPFRTFTLDTNYRSPRNIVEHAQKLIQHNSRRVHKTIRANKTDEASIQVTEVQDLGSAMDLVYEEVERCVAGGASPSRLAILGRKRSQIIPYQVFFASKGVSFCAAEDLQVFMSGAFDRLLELLVIKCRADQRRLRSEVVTDFLKLCDLAKRYPLSRADKESVRQHLQQSRISTLLDGTYALDTYEGTLKGTNPGGRTSKAIADSIRAFFAADTVSEALEEMGARFEGLQIDLGKAEDDIFFADPPFLHLAEYATRYDGDYDEFLSDIQLAKDHLAYLPPFEDDSKAETKDDLWKRPVHLMTALRSKGKEFDTVILLDTNDGIWPNKNAQTIEQREAERRVFYVAFTRAKERVLMLVDKSIGSRSVAPSPFISELGL